MSNEQVKKPRVMWIETSNRGQGKLPDLVYDVEPNMEDSFNKQHSIKVIEAAPTMALIDKLEAALKHYAKLEDWKQLPVEAREALNQLNQWRTK